MEYRLKSCLPDSEHHVMILPSNISLLDLAPNLCMYRDASLVSNEEFEPIEQEPLEPGVSIAPFGQNPSKSKSKTFMKKSQIVQMEEEDETRLREQETAPWVLEDEEQRAFLGRLEGGQESNYVLFVNQGTEFCVIPASKWYKFIPKIQYSTLSLEEAEAKMTSRKKTIDDRWMMHKKVEEAEEAPKPAARRKSRSIEAADFGDELDFEEVFDDDEGIDINSGGDEEELRDDASRLLGKSRKKLSSQGKEMKKLVRHLDKGNLYISDEERNPYAENDDDTDSSEEYQKPVGSSQTAVDLDIIMKPQTKRPLEEDVSSIKVPRKSKPTREDILKRRIKDSIHLVPSPSSTPPQQPQELSLLTEDDIISALKPGPITTKELISKIKPKLSRDARNKELFASFLKKLAIMHSEDKTLELKDSFK